MRGHAILFASALLVPFFASGAGCEMTTSPTEVDAAGYYVNADCWQPGCQDVISIWVYEESNGIPGLQRGDEIVDDTCGGTAGTPDTILF